MKTDLLASKFYFPPQRIDLVQRQRLRESLTAGLSGKVTLVSAPAGFGKTTEVSEWIRDCGYSAAWLSLDKNDNDPVRFLTYFIAAVQSIDPEIGVDVKAVLEESPSPHFENLLTRLINEMERLPEKHILVLDDYHLIESKPVHDIINFLVEYLPATIHLVIAGRTDPPLPISKLRVQGYVHEVRTAQLRFTKKEVAAFLNDLMGFRLSSDGIEALGARTEGWIASLKLAALSMQGREDLTKFIAKFSGSNRYVIDYLIDEVMARQPEEVQIFLRRTSILERFNLSLCEYLVGVNEELNIIDYLDRSNLFLIPLDDHREWYRYHHLFADFLSHRLRISEPDAIPELHRRASRWYENEGLVDEAIQHALAAEDFEIATRLVDGIAADLLLRAESNKLLKYVEQLPSDYYQEYPMLCVWYAWALLFLGQLERVEPVLARLDANPKKVPGVPNPGYVTTVRAYLTNREGDLLKSFDLSKQALEEMSKAVPDRYTLAFQGSAVIWLGVNHRRLGNLDTAKQLFIDAGEMNQKAGNYHAALASFEQLADLAVVRGQPRQASDIYRRGLHLAQKWKDADGNLQGFISATAGIHLGLGTVLYQLNELDAAAAHLELSADIFELGEHYGRMYSYTMLAYLKQAQGELERAVELYRKACTIEDTIVLRQSHTSSRLSLTRLGIILSRTRPELAHLVAEAQTQAENLGVHVSDEVDFTSPAGYPREVSYSYLANLLIALDRAAEALPLLIRLLEAAIVMDRHGDEIRYLILISLAYYSLGDTAAALVSLGQALKLAEPQGYVRVFVDEGQPMAELLGSAVSHNISAAYASKLFAFFPEDVLRTIPKDKNLAFNTKTLVEPLSEREIEVLRLIAEGYKYKEIADILVVSINTVRHHTRNVYSKLNANNRTQAIIRANEFNLL